MDDSTGSDAPNASEDTLEDLGAEQATQGDEAPDEPQDAQGAGADEATQDDPSAEQAPPPPLKSESEGDQNDVEALKKRLSGAHRSWQEEHQKRLDYERKMQEYEQRLAEIEAARKSQESPAPVWRPESPQHQQYATKRPLVEQYLRQVREAGDDQDLLERIGRSWSGVIEEGDVAAYMDEQRAARELQLRLASNPREALSEVVRAEASALLQEMWQQQQQQAERQQTEAHFKALYDKAEYKPILSDPSGKQAYVELVKNGWDPEPALEFLRVKRENDRLLSLAAKGEAESASARAQRQALKGKARVEADVPLPSPVQSKAALFDEARRLAKAAGAEIGSAEHRRIIRTLESKLATTTTPQTA